MGLRALYVCYQSLDDPLIHTQVVAYLEGLTRRGHTVHLLTFEPGLEPARRDALHEEMRGRGIDWHTLRYHKRPSLPATVYDTLAGAVLAFRLVRRHHLDAIHARNHVPAAMALMTRRLTGSRLIFDLRGLMADEYADAGIWRRGGVPYRLTEWVQRRALRRADGVVTLTEAVRDRLAGATRAGVDIRVIPCCVDLDRIERDGGDRDGSRAQLGIDGRPVIVYVGKFTGWYMDAEMVDFFVAARAQRPGLLLLVITQADPAPLQAALASRGVSPSDYVITSAAPPEVGRHLAAADFGISLVRPCVSKVSSSPTKIGEYLAAGLPTVSTAIGDLPKLFSDGAAGVLVEEFSDAGYEGAAERILALVDDPATRARCRALAHRWLSLEDVGIPRYDALYREVASL